MLATDYQETPAPVVPGVTEDTDPLDSKVFFTVPERRCLFSFENRSVGPQALAHAVLLRALEDGVNETWLRLLCDFYEVDLPEEYLSRPPEQILRMSPFLGQFQSVKTPKLVLSWFDLSPIREIHLTEVA